MDHPKAQPLCLVLDSQGSLVSTIIYFLLLSDIYQHPVTECLTDGPRADRYTWSEITLRNGREYMGNWGYN